MCMATTNIEKLRHQVNARRREKHDTFERPFSDYSSRQIARAVIDDPRRSIAIACTEVEKTVSEKI
jgi:hypothetical protein